MKLDTVCSNLQCFSCEFKSNQVAALDSTVLWMNATWFMVRASSKRTAMLTGGFFVLLLRVVFFLWSPRLSLSSFFIVFPKSLWAYGFALGGGCGRQGTSGRHPRVSYRYMNLGV